MKVPIDTHGWRLLIVEVVRDLEVVMDKLGFADRWVPIEILVACFGEHLSPGQMKSDLRHLLDAGQLERKVGLPRKRDGRPARPWRMLYRTAKKQPYLGPGGDGGGPQPGRYGW